MTLFRSEGTKSAELIVQEIDDEKKVKDVVNALNNLKETPLYVAVDYSDNVDLVEFLVKK